MAADASALHERIRARLKMCLVDLLDGAPQGRQIAQERNALEEQLRQAVRAFVDEARAPQLTPEEQDRLIREAITEMVGYGILDQLIADATISEIMVNGPSEIYVERDGRLERTTLAFRDTNQLMATIERMLGTVHLSVNESNPLCDASLPDGSRLNVIIPPLVLNGPVVTIRRQLREWTMRDFIATGALSEQAAEFLEGCVKSKVNMIVSGGTSTGKTTMVSILAGAIPSDQRIITIENVSELELPTRDHWIRLVAKAPNVENRGEIPLRALVKNALRMRPDRIILGEARGGEALDVVQAMHSGHDGVVTVLHGNTPRAALERLETLMLMSGLELPPAACRTQIASAVDIVIHLGRFADGSRRVAAISQVLGASQEGYMTEDLFVLDIEGFSPESQLKWTCRYTGAKPKFLSKFHSSNVPIPAWVTT